MSHADQVVKEALVHGTAQLEPNMEATWSQVNRRIAASGLRRRMLRIAAAAAASLALATVAVPGLRAAAGGFWNDLLTVNHGNAALIAVTTDAPIPLLSQNMTLQSATVTTNGSVQVTVAQSQTITRAAPAGQLPDLSGLPLPARAPSPLPQAAVQVTTTVNAKDEALQGMQLIRMAWADGTAVEQQTTLTRAAAGAAWAASDAPRTTLLPIGAGGTAPTEQQLTESVSAMRTTANGHVFYHFSDAGTDFTVSGPAAQEEQVLALARSLLQ